MISGYRFDTPEGRDVLFRRLLERNGVPQPEAEVTFAKPRRFRFDYAWPAQKVALEVEGGVWTRGRHTRGSGFLRDMVKYNLAALRGWKVFRTTPDKLHHSDTVSMLKQALTQTEAA